MARQHDEMSPATIALLEVIKPLTAAEERRAVAAAVEQVGQELSQRYQVFPAELRIEKPPKPRSTPQRAIAVLIVDYDKRRTMEVVVSAQGRLVRKTDLTGFQPAFLAEEVRLAREIAERDERVARVMRVRGVFVSPFGPDRTEEPGARLVGLRYAAVSRRDGLRLLGEAVVDLSEQALVTFREIQQEKED
jgi:Cu2+-containing amine oxidase